MSSVDGASRAQPPRTTPSSAPTRADPNDVRAMREAIDAARGRVDKAAGQPGRKAHGQVTAERGREGVVADRHQEQPVSRLRSRQEGSEALAGWNGQAPAAVTTTVAADVTAPHVDAGAFAQMLADLWTRENGRGSKEVRVRFGDRAWPATGARLVRNAAGSLDVALLVGDGGRTYGDRLGGLEDALTGAGIDLASLAIENDA
jgi:hypothetical protein